MLENEFFLLKDKKLLISDSFSHAESLIKRFVLKNKKPVINIEKMTIISLCQSLYQKYSNTGFKIIDDTIGAYIVDYLIRINKYDFIPENSYALSTSEIFYDSIKEIKYGRINNSNNARYLEILPLIDDYENYLVENSLMDYADLINQCLGYLNKDNLALGESLIIGISGNLKGKLRYIEEQFVSKICQIYGENELNYIDFESELEDVKKIKVDAHGYINEVKYVIDDIRENNYHLSDIDIYVSDNSYNRIIKSLFEYYDISYVFNEGQTISYQPIFSIFTYALDFASNSCQLSSLYCLLESDALKDEFKSLIPHLSNLKNDDVNIEKYIGTDRLPLDVNQKLFLDKILSLEDYQADIVTLFDKLFDFVQYAAKENDFDFIFDGLQEIREVLTYIHEESVETFNKKITAINKLLSKLVGVKEDNNASIRISSLTNGYVLERKYNYFLGLSATQLTVKEIQSPVLNDEQLLDLLDDRFYIKLSRNNNKELMHGINNLLNSAFDNRHIAYIYSSYDSVNFKNQAPSTLYIDVDAKEVTSNYEIDRGALTKQEESCHLAKKIENFNFSPSALETFASCPIKYIYQYVEQYEQVNIPDYSGNWLQGGEFGTFCHAVLEKYFKNNNTADKQKILDLPCLHECINETKEEMVKLLPFSSVNAIEMDVKKATRLLQSYLKNYFDNNDGYVVVACEYNFNDDGVSEIIEIEDKNVIVNYHGVIDRIDVKVDDEGNFFIRTIDYKTTGKSKLNSKVKKGKTFQNHIYKLAAKNYCLKHKAKLEKILQKPLKFEKSDDITNISFDYVLLKEKPNNQILCADEYEVLSEAKLKQIIKAIISYNENFDISNLLESINLTTKIESQYNSSSCKYCPFGEICQLKIKEGEKMYPDDKKEESDGKDN